MIDDWISSDMEPSKSKGIATPPQHTQRHYLAVPAVWNCQLWIMCFLRYRQSWRNQLPDQAAVQWRAFREQGDTWVSRWATWGGAIQQKSVQQQMHFFFFLNRKCAWVCYIETPSGSVEQCSVNTSILNGGKKGGSDSEAKHRPQSRWLYNPSFNSGCKSGLGICVVLYITYIFFMFLMSAATTESFYSKERWSLFSSPYLQKPLLQVSYASSSSLPAR